MKKVYHIKLAVVPLSLPGKLEEILNDIPGEVVSICQHPEYPDNWRIFWAETVD